MQTPVATFDLPLSTGVNVQDATTYKGKIDGNFAVMARIADAFAAHANSTPDMRVYLDPGHVYTGTALTEVGAYTQGTVTNGSTSVAITGSTAGISGTMLVSGPGIPANTTATISGSTVTLSQAASGLASSPQTGAPLKFMQRTGAITAPVSNSRIDRVVVDRISGAVSVITGTSGASPSAPALTAGVVPIAQVLLTSTTTAITNSMITDERDLALVGTPAGNQISVASATTTDIGTAKSDNILITGTTTITSLGSSASTEAPLYFVTFSGALTLTNNNTSLILPGGQNIKTAANDSGTFIYLGSGNWQCVDYQRANGQTISIFGAPASIASASTTDLGTITGNYAKITGTTTITALGSSASTANPIYFVRFGGALTLTYNASSLILPGAANITTAAGDFGIFEYLGSGNWQCLNYYPATGKPLASSGVFNQQTFTSSGTWTKPAGYDSSSMVLVECWGAGGSGGGGAGQYNGGGGGGSYKSMWLPLSSMSATETITVGTGGTGVSSGNGNNGGSSSIGSHITAYGGTGGQTASSAGKGGAGGGIFATATAGAAVNDFGVEGSGGATASAPGQAGFFIGGGGGGGASSGSSTATGLGGNSVWGGGGGGAVFNGGGTAGGSSYFGGAGSAGNTSNAGTQPGGGSGGAITSGNGGAGQARITVYA